jgi:hypothetical protein
MKNAVNVPLKNKQKNLGKIFFVGVLKVMKKAEPGSEFVGQRYGSADPNPDSYQNVTDPEHCKL